MKKIKQSEYKKLNTERNVLQTENTNILRAVTEKQDEISRNLKKIKVIDKKIKLMTGSDLVVTEHAVIRFMERHMLYDINQIKDKILPPESSKAIKSLGNGKYPIGDHIIVINNGVVVTVE